MVTGGLPVRLFPHLPLRPLVFVVALTAAPLMGSCGSRCDSHVDYTIPPVANILGGATAVVRAYVVRFTNVAAYTVEVELDVTELLLQVAETPAGLISEGPLVVGAYDDPCGRRTGLRFTEGKEVLIVLRWLGPDNSTWDTPFQAFPILAEDPDGSVRFLDTGQALNERINDILNEPTLAGLLRAVWPGSYPSPDL
ncbi:MAG: hypothetical protein JW785_11450 [Acidimicrobiia bacterium]|nr:hypothetical protein [Acidimicrobiia bacterium]